MKRGGLIGIIILVMIATFWLSPGTYGFLVGGTWALVFGSLPALLLSALARVFVRRRAWRLLVVPLLSGAAYLSLSRYVADVMPPHVPASSGGFAALVGFVLGAAMVVLLELALGTPERFLRTPHDQHP